MNPCEPASKSAGRLTRRRRGFTLIELLVVIGLIGVIAGVWLSFGGEGGQAAALRSAEATVTNLLIAARTRAVATGRPARVAVQCDPVSPQAHERYLRYLVLQSRDETGWQTIADAFLAPGAYLLPRDPASVPGLLKSGQDWTRPSDGQALRSSALRSAAVTADAEFDAALNGEVVERWAAIVFSGLGTTPCSGDLVLARGRVQPTVPPVVFDTPDHVCGAAVSTYGLVTRRPDRTSF